MQAKFVACYEATSQTVWLNNFIFELQVIDNIIRSLTLFCDNEPAVVFSKNKNQAVLLNGLKLNILLLETKSNIILLSYNILI
jgi:hypothetical protein